MSSDKPRMLKKHAFQNKLLLNHWLISLFGIEPLAQSVPNVKSVRPFRQLAEPISHPQLEGLDHDNLHYFYHHLVGSELFSSDLCVLTQAQLRAYEQNIVRHTRHINQQRQRPVVWKYYQWLTLLFVEIYLDRYFSDREGLLDALNLFVARFNKRWSDHGAMPEYLDEDLNKLCLQSATGSGKTLLMHINMLQYSHYAGQHNRSEQLSRVILLTPNERLSAQHIAELEQSAIGADYYQPVRDHQQSHTSGTRWVDVLEITRLADRDGPNTMATRSFGDRNLLLVDEGHRGMSGKEAGAWYTRRSQLCEKGFSFEYSATFAQALHASGNSAFEDAYAKAVLFDYSYRWFYEDGFGKDYKILNLPASFDEVQFLYMTACLLKFYQQLRIYEEKFETFVPFNLEKPLWVFVGSTVSPGKMTKDEQIVASDVALIIGFMADFLDRRPTAERRINEILTGKGQDTGLLDQHGGDIFAHSFDYLAQAMNAGQSAKDLYQDILLRLFNCAAGGQLSLERIQGDTGEVVLRAGLSDKPFGLINVGDAKNLCDHVVAVTSRSGTRVSLKDSEFTEALFDSVKSSGSAINVLVGSKKFVEGWDCWRVSTLGLMHVGRSEGAQIIQLFGRGVRLKGHGWSLKRSAYSHVYGRPRFIEELETLNVFGIEADFMERFRQFLENEGLAGNERHTTISIPLHVAYDSDKPLKTLRPKRKMADGREYDFKVDGAIPSLGEVPDYLIQNPVVADWYPRIKTSSSGNSVLMGKKDCVSLSGAHLALLDYDLLFFELEAFKRERGWHNFNIAKQNISSLLGEPGWYILYLPEARLSPSDYEGVLFLQRVALELLKRYCDHLYNYCRRAYLEPRLECRTLTLDDGNLPSENTYQLTVEARETQIIQGIWQIKKKLADENESELKIGDLSACRFEASLVQPLLYVRSGSPVSVSPAALNESEYRFITDLKNWCEARHALFEQLGIELHILRNPSRGNGLGFFEAGNFHPDFILWITEGSTQNIAFIEPHGLVHEGPASPKIQFYKRITDVERRLDDASIALNSFVLSWTRYQQLQWDYTKDELEDMHILFMTDDQDQYIDKLFARVTGNRFAGLA